LFVKGRGKIADFNEEDLSVNILIQNLSTRLFAKGDGQWVSTAGEALAFENSGAAVDYCVAQRLQGIRLVLNFNDPVLDAYRDAVEGESAPGGVHEEDGDTGFVL
jgi:hypothetical protein